MLPPAKKIADDGNRSPYASSSRLSAGGLQVAYLAECGLHGTPKTVKQNQYITQMASK